MLPVRSCTNDATYKCVHRYGSKGI